MVIPCTLGSKSILVIHVGEEGLTMNGIQKKRVFLHGEVIVQALFLLPAFVFFTLFTVYPAMTSLYYSMTDWNGIAREYSFVGIQNYAEMFRNEDIFSTIPVTIYYAALNSVLLLIVAFLIALALNRTSKITSFLRISFFLPMLVSPMIVGFVFKEMYGPYISEGNMGSFNRILQAVGLESWMTNWLGNPSTAMPMVVITGVWYQVGTTALIYLANLQSIPGDLYEAAKIDGAGYWREVYYVTLKMMLPAITINSILLLINSLKSYDMISILTAGGPGTSTKVINLSIVEYSITNYRVGLGCAMSMVLTAFVFMLVTTVQKLLSKWGA